MVSTLGGKAGKAEKSAFFQVLAGKAGKHHLFLLPWLEKLEFFFFPFLSIFIGQLNINILEIQNELITLNTYNK